MQDEIVKAYEVIKEIGYYPLPTDTVWGIGCDATNAEAVAKIYKLKCPKHKV
jgi:L-threonylcarbamoyladenylate synthase